MVSLKKILLKEATPFVPFTSLNNNIVKYWEGKGKGRRYGTNALVSIFGTAAIGVYLIGSIHFHTPNVKNWGGIIQKEAEQREIEQETNQRNFLMQEFNNADVNKNYALDSTEFYNYFKNTNEQ